jgi:prepilin-type N-terminal cleavage/methylation domain-containing protein
MAGTKYEYRNPKDNLDHSVLFRISCFGFRIFNIGRPDSYANRTIGNRGFTLLELLVAMVLVSAVTLIVGVALKLGIGAWERGVKEGETAQLCAAIPSLLGKQIRSLVKVDPFQAGGKRALPFCGQAHDLSFFTSYAPQGSSLQGLLRVTYVFDEDEKTLSIYEQVVTRKEDLKEELNPLSDVWNKSFDPVSLAPNVVAFDLRYTANKNPDPKEESQWKEQWDCRSTTRPAGVMVRFQVGKDEKAKSFTWFFQTEAGGP